MYFFFLLIIFNTTLYEKYKKKPQFVLKENHLIFTWKVLKNHIFQKYPP